MIFELWFSCEFLIIQQAAKIHKKDQYAEEDIHLKWSLKIVSNGQKKIDDKFWIILADFFQVLDPILSQ